MTNTAEVSYSLLPDYSSPPKITALQSDFSLSTTFSSLAADESGQFYSLFDLTIPTYLFWYSHIKVVCQNAKM